MFGWSKQKKSLPFVIIVVVFILRTTKNKTHTNLHRKQKKRYSQLCYMWLQTVTNNKKDFIYALIKIYVSLVFGLIAVPVFCAQNEKFFGF